MLNPGPRRLGPDRQGCLLGVGRVFEAVQLTEARAAAGSRGAAPAGGPGIRSEATAPKGYYLDYPAFSKVFVFKSRTE